MHVTIAAFRRVRGAFDSRNGYAASRSNARIASYASSSS